MPPPPRMHVGAGLAADYSFQTPARVPNPDGTPNFANGFVSADSIQATVWAGDGTTGLASPAVVWGGTLQGVAYEPLAGAPITLWTITLGANDAGGLAPGVYRLRVTATHNSKTGWLWDGLLDVADSPGGAVGTGLITLTYAESALTRLRLSREERDFLPYLVTVASDEIVKWCLQRDFIRQTYTEEYRAELNGYVALRQMPVNNVLRIRGYPQTVLSVSGIPGTCQEAWLSYTTSGDWYTNTLVYTGIVLTSISNGITTTTPILFASCVTINDLATQISATPGFQAYTEGVFGLLPIGDLAPPGGVVAQGCLDDDGAELVAYTEDLTCSRLDNALGMLWVGRHRISGTTQGRWGPEEGLLDDTNGDFIGRVQVTYDAGFTVVPSVVQHATAMLVKALVEESRINHMLMSESISGAGSRAYAVAAELMTGLPRPVLQRLSQYRMLRAR
jgi:hypothetical protein